MRTTHPTCFDRMEVKVSDLLVVFFHGAQGRVEKASLPPFAGLLPSPVHQDHCTGLEGFHDVRDRQRIPRGAEGMPVIGKRDPGGQKEGRHRPHSVEGERQQMEIGVHEFGAPLEQPHRHEDISIGEKRTMEP